ncbi:MAG TPA: erythromycin esterase family protein [Alphaproteobacteria bacterium]
MLAREACPFDPWNPQSAIEQILDCIGDRRLVLLGEATHGTSEFYRFRAGLTATLIQRRGFRIVALEADWPDARRLDDFVRHRQPAGDWTAFARFPTWMWRNREMLDFCRWLRVRNLAHPIERRAGLYGLDLYSLSSSIAAVLQYLNGVDPELARRAAERYACFSPFLEDPASYGEHATLGGFQGCEREALDMLGDLLRRQLQSAGEDQDRFLDAAQNARLVANAEAYYRSIYYGDADSWNLRDSHMFETLTTLLEWQGGSSKAVVWAHNSHLGDARATQMARRGEHNIGQLCRERFGEECFLLGFGTDRGTVAAATDWGGPMEIKQVRPARGDSYEGLCRRLGIPAFHLPLLEASTELREGLEAPRLERAIGVIYRPESERYSHYFEARLPSQFDHYVWFDETAAVDPLPTAPESGPADTFPFGV